MSKKLFFLIGLLTGALLLELFHRPLKARLQAYQADEAKREEYHAWLRQDRQNHYNSLSPEDKMAFTVRMADWGDEDEADE